MGRELQHVTLLLIRSVLSSYRYLSFLQCYPKGKRRWSPTPFGTRFCLHSRIVLQSLSHSCFIALKFVTDEMQRHLPLCDSVSFYSNQLRQARRQRTVDIGSTVIRAQYLILVRSRTHEMTYELTPILNFCGDKHAIVVCEQMCTKKKYLPAR